MASIGTYIASIRNRPMNFGFGRASRLTCAGSFVTERKLAYAEVHCFIAPMPFLRHG